MTTSSQIAALAAVLPATNVYVGLLTSVPTLADGSDYGEAAAGGYARVAFNTWLSTAGVNPKEYKRQNNANITFPAFTAPQAGIEGWAIFSSSGIGTGTVIAFGKTKDVSGAATVMSYAIGDQPQFQAGDLAIRLDAGT